MPVIQRNEGTILYKTGNTRWYFSAIFMFFICSIINGTSVKADQKDQTLLPVEAYAALPSFSNAQLSPSGSHLAYFVENQGERHLIVGKLDGSSPLIVSPPAKQTLISFQWKNDTTIIYRTSLSIKRRSLKRRTTETRIYRLDLSTNTSRWLGAPNRTNLRETEGQHERIVSMLPHDPDQILIELDLNRNGYYEVYKVSLNSGHKKFVQREDTFVQSWEATPDGSIRLSTGFRGEEAVTHIKMPDGEWVNILELEWAKQYNIEGFSNNPDIIYVSGANKYGMHALYTLDLNSGNVLDTLFSHTSIDMAAPVRNPRTGEVIGVSYIDDFRRIRFFDTTLAQIQQSIDLALPETVNTITSTSSDQSLYFVLSHNARKPGDYYMYNRLKRTLSYVAPSRALINENISANTLKVTIQTRDNTELYGYLTLPADLGATLNLPTVILPHGGPYGVRDDASWDYEAQFYASRGYLVLKPNFRGSGGYGIPFLEAGFKQWGGLMQTDVTDATQWLIEKGYANPERICIVGSSYGGYAALMAGIQEPELYKCAISINGVTDLARMKDSDRLYSIGGRSWSDRWGLENANDESVSPFHNAEKLNVPILLMASPDDARVPFKLSEDMHEKLIKLGKASTFVRIETGTHNMVNATARRTMLESVVDFLNQHIGDNSTRKN